MFKLKKIPGLEFRIVGPVYHMSIMRDGTVKNITDHRDGFKEVEIRHPDGREEKFSIIDAKASGPSLPAPRKRIESR